MFPLTRVMGCSSEMKPSPCHQPLVSMCRVCPPQSLRRGSSVFAGKHGFITLRDLFRWAERYRLEEQTEASQDWLQHLADDGEACQPSVINLHLVRVPLITASVLSIRLHAAGRTRQEAGGRGHHPLHPGEAFQEIGEP